LPIFPWGEVQGTTSIGKVREINHIDFKGDCSHEQEKNPFLPDRSFGAYIFKRSLLVFVADGCSQKMDR
jgi:hypothetical protein